MREVVYPDYAIRFEEGRHRYWLSGLDAENLPVWESVPSVTGIVDPLCEAPFGKASSWGQKVGIWSVLGLEQNGLPRDFAAEPFDKNHPDLRVWLDAAKQAGRSPYRERAQAGKRGSAVHYAAQHWAEFGEEIDPLGYPESDMGYVLALKNWLDEANPTVLDVEQMVASKRHGYAGTLDLRAVMTDGRMGLIDYKTTTYIKNPNVDYQLAMYELASQECGYPPTDFRAVLRLDESGSWEWYESPTLTSAVEPLLEVWEERKRIEEHVKALKAAPHR